MVPRFEEFLYPFLLSLKDGEITLAELRPKLIDYLKLSDEDLCCRTRSGSSTQFNDRINWARQYLRRALFIEIPQHGTYRITKRGSSYLSEHESLRINDLMSYQEFASFSSGRRSSNETANPITFQNQELTPTEQLEQAYESIENDLATDLLAKVMEQSPAFFEHLVIDLLVKMGYGGSFADSARVTQLSNDEGIDGIIYEDKLGLDKIYIQAKKWSNQIGRPIIQQFAGALAGQNATKGVFITTSNYSKEARQFVDGLHQKIVLLDGKDLSKYMIEYNVGVSTKKTYEVKRIDLDYFEEQ